MTQCIFKKGFSHKKSWIFGYLNKVVECSPTQKNRKKQVVKTTKVVLTFANPNCKIHLRLNTGFQLHSTCSYD